MSKSCRKSNKQDEEFFGDLIAIRETPNLLQTLLVVLFLIVTPVPWIIAFPVHLIADISLIEALVLIELALAVVGLIIVWRVSKKLTKLARRDLSCDLREITRLKIVQCKRFQELEHGGYINFLLTSDDRVYCLYDHASAGEEGIFLHPQTDLEIVHFKNLELNDIRWSGETLEGDRVKQMGVCTNYPETEEFCSFNWDEIEAHVGERGPAF